MTDYRANFLSCLALSLPVAAIIFFLADVGSVCVLKVVLKQLEKWFSTVGNAHKWQWFSFSGILIQTIVKAKTMCCLNTCDPGIQL